MHDFCDVDNSRLAKAKCRRSEGQTNCCRSHERRLKPRAYEPRPTLPPPTHFLKWRSQYLFHLECLSNKPVVLDGYMQLELSVSNFLSGAVASARLPRDCHIFDSRPTATSLLSVSGDALRAHWECSSQKCQPVHAVATLSMNLYLTQSLTSAYLRYCP